MRLHLALRNIAKWLVLDTCDSNSSDIYVEYKKEFPVVNGKGMKLYSWETQTYFKEIKCLILYKKFPHAILLHEQ